MIEPGANAVGIRNPVAYTEAVAPSGVVRSGGSAEPVGAEREHPRQIKLIKGSQGVAPE